MKYPPWVPKPKHWRIRPNSRWWTPEEWRLLERYRLAGRTWGNIAKRLGRSEVACRVAWCRHGPSPEYRKIYRFVVMLQGVAKSISVSGPHGISKKTLVRKIVNHGLKMVHREPVLEREGAQV